MISLMCQSHMDSVCHSVCLSIKNGLIVSVVVVVDFSTVGHSVLHSQDADDTNLSPILSEEFH